MYVNLIGVVHTCEKCGNENEIVVESVMVWVLWEFGNRSRFIFGFGEYWFRNFSRGCM